MYDKLNDPAHVQKGLQPATVWKKAYKSEISLPMIYGIDMNNIPTTRVGISIYHYYVFFFFFYISIIIMLSILLRQLELKLLLTDKSLLLNKPNSDRTLV